MTPRPPPGFELIEEPSRAAPAVRPPPGFELVDGPSRAAQNNGENSGADDMIEMPMLDGMGVEVGTHMVPRSSVRTLPQQLRDVGTEINSGVRMLANGITLGGMNELAANLNTGFGATGDYDAELAAQRQQDREIEARNPAMAASHKIVGGVGGMAALGVPSLAMKAGGALGRTAAGLAEGAGYGATQGFLEGEGEGRLRSAGTGALWGAGGGVAAPALASGVGAVTRGVRNMRAPVPEELQHVHRGAASRVARAVTDDARAGYDVQGELARMTPEGMLLDAPGVNVRTQAEALFATPGRGGATIARTLNERAGGAADRIRGAADDALGTTAGRAAEREAILAARETNIGPLYDMARQHGQPLDSRNAINLIDDALLTAAGKKRSALQEIRTQLVNGEIPKSSAAALHEVRSEIGRGMRNEWRDVTGALRPIQRAIDEQLDTVPGYASARSQYAESKEIEEALDEGGMTWQRGTRRDDLERRLAEMSDPERRAYLAGARDAAAESMDNAGRSLGQTGADVESLRGPMSLWGSPAGQDKLRMVARTPEAGDAAVQRMQDEAAMAARANEIVGNSRTAARQAAQGEFPAPSQVGVNRNLAPATLPGMGLAAADFLARKLSMGALDARRARIGEGAAELLTTGGDAKQALARALMQYGERREVGREAGERARRLAHALMNPQSAGIAAPQLGDMIGAR
jgi:hypothetical protein